LACDRGWDEGCSCCGAASFLHIPATFWWHGKR